MAKVYTIDKSFENTTNPVSCTFCGDTVGLVIKNKEGKTICKDCIVDAKALLKEE